MENKTLKELKAIARERGLEGYRMKKAELAEALTSQTPLVDAPVPRANVPRIMEGLRALARERRVRGYRRMERAELVEALSRSNANILDSSVPEVNVPVLRPTPYVRPGPPSLMRLAKKAVSSVQRKINEFSDWILSVVPERVRRATNARVEKLKGDVKKIFQRIRGVRTRMLEQAIIGYMETHRIDGTPGSDANTFLSDSKPAIISLINGRRNPLSSR